MHNMIALLAVCTMRARAALASCPGFCYAARSWHVLEHVICSNCPKFWCHTFEEFRSICIVAFGFGCYYSVAPGVFVMPVSIL
jgi:hypothetical protein